MADYEKWLSNIDLRHGPAPARLGGGPGPSLKAGTIGDNIRIRLTWLEIEIAAHVGVQRNIQSLREARKPGAGMGLEDTWTKNIEGAAAEMAVAKHFGVYWSGNVGNYEADDVGPYQVRANCTRKFEDMTIRPRDKDHKPYISVLCFLPEFVICGWFMGGAAKRPEWVGQGTPGRPPLWYVPRAALHPLSELPVIS